MKKISWKTIFIVLLFVKFSFSKNYLYEIKEKVKPVASTEDQHIAFKQLLFRVLHEKDAQDIEFEINPKYAPNIEMLTDEGKLIIFAPTAVDAAYGLNYYLKYYCKKQLSWAGDNLGRLPRPIPELYPVKITAGVNYRYYQNVCTVSYSFVWWDWKRWEREIDWMALNGINLPLAFSGQEEIWDRIYKSYGCTQEDMDSHFTGPAYLAWGRMGNLKGFAGPLPNTWKKNQLKMQHLILKRMRELGMIPVLPAFAGHIPECITRIFPKANYTRLSGWSHFDCNNSCSLLLDPNDPLFKKIGSQFIEEQIKEYNGTNHIYNCDIYNEMIPRSNDPYYLGNSSYAVFNAMQAADEDAHWLMQGWLFYNAGWFWKDPQKKALLTSVPKGRMIVLDLFAESFPMYNESHSFYGQPFIWCMLHDFGGNLGFYGKIQHINKDPMTAYNSVNSSMVGIGITPEGINQNYFLYEMMLDIGYQLQSIDVDRWMEEFVERRYGVYNKDANIAWKIFANTIYNFTQEGRPSTKVLIRGPICKRPSLSYSGVPDWYTVDSQLEAWDHFMSAIKHLPFTATTRYDAVDVTRQMLEEIHRYLYYNIIEAYMHKKSYSIYNVKFFGRLMMILFDQMDRILSTDSNFTLESWINAARNSGTTKEESDLFEKNARLQVTTWGENGEIMDYADKHWSTLMSQYYKPRWELFIEYVENSMKSNTTFPHLQFVQDVFNNVEKPFTEKLTTTKLQTTSGENTFFVAREIYDFWRPMLGSNPKARWLVPKNK